MIKRMGLACFGVMLLTALPPVLAEQIARGVVFHDRNGNGLRDPGDPGLAGMRVSNGMQVVMTNEQGQYELPIEGDAVIFLLKPRDWTPPLNEQNLPQFYYIHRPDGSPRHLQYAGVEPTGPLPDSIDFPLHPAEEPEQFRVVVWADPQVSTPRMLDLLQRDVIPELVGVDAAFGVSLGDIAWDNLDYFPLINKAVAHIGIPWYNVIGNHDLNFDHTSPETFIRHYGPSWYAFDYGPVHFIALDNTRSDGNPDTRGYSSALGPEQVAFFRNNLRDVPQDRLVVLMMHVNLTASLREAEDQTREFFSLFEGREHVVAIAGHNHRNLFTWFGGEQGWPNEQPLYLRVAGAVSGNWWRGPYDEFQMPFAMMRDGAPRGYFFFTFSGNQWSYRFKATRRPDDHQMHLHFPRQVPRDALADTEVLANVYGGNDRSTVEMRIGQGEWILMERTPRPDPYYELLYDLQERHKEMYRALPGLASQGPPMNSTHLWRAPLPANLPAGSHLVTVRSTDMFGQTFIHHRPLRIVEPEPQEGDGQNR
jgi:hypothetical protein